MTGHRLVVWYNTRCPVCDAGIDWQRNKLLAALRAGDISFQDINLEPQALAAFGASLDDIVELVSYHVGLQGHLARFIEIKSGYIREPFPTWTILEIAGLARPGLVIEIKAVAYKPLK